MGKAERGCHPRRAAGGRRGLVRIINSLGLSVVIDEKPDDVARVLCQIHRVFRGVTTSLMIRTANRAAFGRGGA